ncbi:GPN-loop GTPase, putative [Ixodes scapularis]|uniref:GPN-loop GTPase 2 n=1 Tax=Ixodes scapularis TaxID=6945 RepID=B7PHV0_IXOSC|nr:GPN-loop GTPase, putative [Ixodes scapularis]|eukprot:XP_002403662.1 GPN-loop GTPase, putative [Ixodes scapularis]
MLPSRRGTPTFGQVVIGPPGSGKSSYCKAMKEFCTTLGRKVAVVNMDPANDVLPYEASVDIAALVQLRDVMDSLRLGPNGGLVYCMEFLEAHLEWLTSQLEAFRDHYLLIDCPGQVELYTHHRSVHNIVSHLQASNFRVSATHLVDSHYCSDPAKFISVLLTSLCTMLQVELPQVNVLSKVDLVESCGRLHFGLDFYTDVLDLSFLAGVLSDDPILRRHKKLNEALAGVVEDYSLVSFLPLNIQDKESMWSVLKACDRSNGYVFGQGEEETLQRLLTSAMQSDTTSRDVIARLHERLTTSGTTTVVEEDEGEASDRSVGSDF